MSVPPIEQLLGLQEGELREIAEHLGLDGHSISLSDLPRAIHARLSNGAAAGSKRKREEADAENGGATEGNTAGNAAKRAQYEPVKGSVGEDDDDDDDIGPAVPANHAPKDDDAEGDDIGPAIPQQTKQHKIRELPLEHVYLSALPSASMYERSYMHRDAVTHVIITNRAEFLVTGSADGVIKFWKKTPGGIEFVKTYRAHVGPIVSIAVSVDGLRLCSCGSDNTLKLYDILNFDMVDMVRLAFAPAAAVWIYKKGSIAPLIAISDRHSSAVHIFNADNLIAGDVKVSVPQDDEGEEVVKAPSTTAAVAAEIKPRRQLTATPIHSLRVHAAPVLCMAYNEKHDVVISADAKGMLEYWTATEASRFTTPGAPMVSFTSKLDTDLFDLAKARCYPQSITVAPTGAMFAVTSTDAKVRVFHFKTGKLARVYAETIETYEALHKEDKLGLDAMDFGRRMAAEKDYIATSIAAIKAFIAPPPEADPAAASKRPDPVYRPPASTAVFDDSGHFLIYPTAIGIKIVNLVTDKTCCTPGRVENSERFLAAALYQGVPKATTQYNLAKEAQEVVIMSEAGENEPKVDPTLVVASFRRNRFYLFTRREPSDAAATSKEGRDVFNEPPSREDLAVSSEAAAALQRAKLGSQATLHTNMGDITFKLLPEIAPKAVENFCGLSRKEYYNGLVFHRVIKDFMIQTGDPRGDGTGGASLWGHDFEDEIDRATRFDRPGMVAMANAGPCTNGSQFFITTAACTWLDGKHSIFGRVLKGMEVVKAIEGVATNKQDKPYDDVRIISISIK